MRFHNFYQNNEPAISFELFPPQTDQGMARLSARLPKLASLCPSYMTVTFGAFGGAREKTLEIAAAIREQHQIETAHHLTCVGSDRAAIDATLEQIKDAGIQNIVALRGDPPAGASGFEATAGGFSYASELVRYIREKDDFGLAVAGYPEKHVEAPDMESDLRFLERKVSAGADIVITQLFYENRHYFEFVQRCRAIGIRCPIVPGLMPVLDLGQIKRITGICGSSIPRSLLKKLEAADGDVEALRRVGIDHTVSQAIDLLAGGAPGIHFYVLNRYFHIAEIMERIRG